MSEIYKDYKKFFYEVWANVCHNYITIFVSLFGKEAPDLYAAFVKFYSCIYKLLTVYKWQEAVFPMAIEAHKFIVV